MLLDKIVYDKMKFMYAHRLLLFSVSMSLTDEESIGIMGMGLLKHMSCFFSQSLCEGEKDVTHVVVALILATFLRRIEHLLCWKMCLLKNIVCI